MIATPVSALEQDESLFVLVLASGRRAQGARASLEVDSLDTQGCLALVEKYASVFARMTTL